MIGEFIIGGISQLKLSVAFCRVFWSVIVVILLVLTCMCNVHTLVFVVPELPLFHDLILI